MAREDWLAELGKGITQMQAGGAAGAMAGLQEKALRERTAEQIMLKHLLDEPEGEAKLVRQKELAKYKAGLDTGKLAQTQKDAVQRALKAYESGVSEVTDIRGLPILTEVEETSRNNLRDFLLRYETKVDWSQFPEEIEKLGELEDKRVRQRYKELKMEKIKPSRLRKARFRTKQEVIDIMAEEGFNMEHPFMKVLGKPSAPKKEERKSLLDIFK